MSLNEIVIQARWIHVLAGAAWFGAVVMVNFVLIPLLGRLDRETRRRFVVAVFPRVFKLASALSATAVSAGLFVMLVFTQGEVGLLVESQWGLAILVGGSLGLTLTLFHFFMEKRLAAKIGISECGPPDEALDDVHLRLKIVPRLGMLVITTIVILMMVAVRGT